MEYQQRSERVRAEMEHHGIDYLFVGPSSDLVYLTGYETEQSERLTLFVLSVEEERPILLLPQFALPHIVERATFFDPATWADQQDPTELLAELVSNRGHGKTIAVGSQLYSTFLLRIQERMPQARYVKGELVVAPVRMRKTQYEIDQLRAAAEAADAVFLALMELPLVGLTEKEIMTHIHRLLLEEGHDRVGGGSVSIGPHGAAPHHHVGNRRATSGDPVLVDFGGVLNGYRSDVARTFHIGPPTDQFRQIYDIVNEANQKSFDAVRPGVPAEDVDAAARDHIKAVGYGSQFIHRTGHGIGLDVHEPPYIVSGNRTPLEEGMTFSIEPGIYLAGEFGIRIEDIVVVTANGAERLNRSTHALQIVG